MGARPQGNPPPIPPQEFKPLASIPGAVDPATVAMWLAQQNEMAIASAVVLDEVTACEAEDIRRLTIERAMRRIEALKLYEPLSEQQKFHAADSRVRLLRGSNRAGKTLSAAVEVARAVTGQDPSKKYPMTDGRWFVVGKDQKHIGQVIYPKLFKSRSFKILRDAETGVWRSFRPWVPEDIARAHEAKPAPPLIPKRFIQQMSWENKKENVPSTIRLTTGWELSFFSSLGKPPQGSDIDGAWFDEEIVDAQWFPEMAARILDRLGRIIWSATPQAGTDQLYELHEQAEREQEQKVEPRTVSEFIVLLDENPHMTEQAKKDFANTLSEEERRVRIGGEFAVSSFKVYPEFSMHIQGVDYRDIPKGWTRFMAVDPGHQICAALFAAVPPPDEGDFLYLFDELYIANCNAAMFASTVKQKTGGDDYHAFVIDAHMGIHTELGVGLTVAQQYTAALKSERVTSRVTGSGFILGSDNVLAGIDAVRSLLRIRPDGTTKLRILRGKLPNLEWELKRYHKKRVNGMVTDMPNQKKNNHLCDSLRYMAMLGPKYVKPLEGKPRISGAASVLKQKMKKRHEMAGGGAVRLGPGR